MAGDQARRTALAVWVATALSCGGGGSSAPTNPAPSPSTPVAVPSPSPTVAPSAAPGAASCPFGKGTPNAFCSRRTPALIGEVDAAIDRLVQKSPQLFSVTETIGPGAFRVLDFARYHQGVVAELQGAGFCAETDNAVVSVRNGMEFSEDYDILLASGHVRRGDGMYRSTCNPPSFPVEFADVFSYLRVAFYSIRCEDGIEVPRNADAVLPIGCTGFITATAKDSNNIDVDRRLVGSEIKWTVEQTGDIVRINEFPDVTFNKIAVPLNAGRYTLCAEVPGYTGCQFGEVRPDPRK
ncbi:MAG TPA: hypothetical protein VMR21_07370 [Vicinamibacteria bacterium]|nr:hypothetical protein [Vicinamibacteria bacterium]